MKSDPRPVVVHPAFAVEWRDVDDFCGEFGPYNGRYVPRYPPGWVQECLSHLKLLDLKPLERARMLETAVKVMAHCSVPGEWAWNNSATWETNANELSKLNPNAIIIGNGLDPEPFKGWPLGVSEVKESRVRSWEYRGTAHEYLDACRPLLLNAPAAYLIDPYLDPLAAPVQDLLESIFNLIKGSKCYEVHVITRQQTCGGFKDEPDRSKWMKEEQIEVTLRHVYGSLVGRGRKLLVHLVERRTRDTAALRLHDRFFLTNFGAINFGRGFVLEHQELPQDTAYVVDRNLHESLKQSYIYAVARFVEAPRLQPNVPRPSKVRSLTVVGQ